MEDNLQPLPKFIINVRSTKFVEVLYPFRPPQLISVIRISYVSVGTFPYNLNCAFNGFFGIRGRSFWVRGESGGIGLNKVSTALRLCSGQANRPDNLD